MIELAASAAHVVVADVTAPVLTEADHHHLARVLRLRVGERVTVTDGRGRWQWCAWTGDDLRVEGDGGEVPPSATGIGVAVALLKGDRLDLVVQKLTEIGVDRIIPMAAELCIVRWTPEKAVTQVERLRRIAHEAAMQSRRVHLPVIDDVVGSRDLLVRPGVIPAIPGAPAWPGPLDGATGPITIAVGPEGGWAASEEAVCGPGVGLGDDILRAETAAIAAGVLLAQRRRQRAG